MGGLCFQVLGSLGVLGFLGVFVFKTPLHFVQHSLVVTICTSISTNVRTIPTQFFRGTCNFRRAYFHSVIWSLYVFIACKLAARSVYDTKSLATYLQWCKLFFVKIGIFSACKTFRQHILFGYELVDIRSVLVVFLKAVEKGITKWYQMYQNVCT